MSIEQSVQVPVHGALRLGVHEIPHILTFIVRYI